MVSLSGVRIEEFSRALIVASSSCSTEQSGLIHVKASPGANHISAARAMPTRRRMMVSFFIAKKKRSERGEWSILRRLPACGVAVAYEFAIRYCKDRYAR